MAPTLPTPPATLDDFKKRYGKRDFKFGTGLGEVTDDDIANAMIDAMTVFNPRRFNVADGWVGFLYVTAHYVRLNIQASGGLSPDSEGLGIENQAEQVRSGASVGGVSENFVDPPDFIRQIPLLLQLWLTTYGQKYVAMLQPKMVGAAGVVSGPIDGGAVGTPDVPFSQ